MQPGRCLTVCQHEYPPLVDHKPLSAENAKFPALADLFCLPVAWRRRVCLCDLIALNEPSKRVRITLWDESTNRPFLSGQVMRG